MGMKNIDEPIFWAPQKKMFGWVCFKDTPKSPEAPDPNVVANAQSNSNIKTAEASAALTHNNSYTPWGSQTWKKTPSQGTFDQAGYDEALKSYNNGLQANGPTWMSNNSAPNRADYTTSGGVDTWESTVELDPAQKALLDASNRNSLELSKLSEDQIGNVKNSIKPLDFSGLPQYTGEVKGVSPIADRIDTNHIGNMQGDINTGNVGQFRNKAGYGNIQDNLDVSKVPEMVGGDDLLSLMNQAQEASFNQQKGYLDPQWNQQRHDLENQLTQQGVLQNSDAWNRAIADHSRNKTFAYQNANDNSVAQGLLAEAQLYGQGLSSNQNAFNQAIGSGNFANSAQAQGFGQDMSNAELNNRVVNDQFNQAQQQAQFHNATVNDKFTQEQAKQQAINAAQNQTFNQMNVRETNNLTARNQGINEILQEQQNPLNVLNALRSGSQIQAPNFGQGNQFTVGNADVQGGYNNQFNAKMGEYNAGVATNNSNTQAGAGLAVAAISTAAMMY